MIAWVRKQVREWPWYAVAGGIVGILVALWALFEVLGSVAGVGLFSALLNLALIPAAVATLFISLRLADRIGGLRWEKLRSQIGNDPLTAVIYLTGRWIALALIISAVLR